MNYFNYFTEIEEHFQRQRGARIFLSPVDWALVASWREAGIPLEAVLAGIDQAFEKFASGRRRDSQRPRALVYCSAAVVAAAEALQAGGAGGAGAAAAAPLPGGEAFHPARIAAHLQAADHSLAACARLEPAAAAVADLRATLARLIAGWGGDHPAAANLEELDRVLSALDAKLEAVLLQCTPVDTLVELRAEGERELAPYRRQLRPEQLALIERQFLHRRLLEHARLPRLSLFYLR